MRGACLIIGSNTGDAEAFINLMHNNVHKTKDQYLKKSVKQARYTNLDIYQ
jgi:hypothetical protein